MQIEKLLSIKDGHVLIYGDFMVDKYIMGSVKRISPEAPVPILNVEKKESKLGGAGNVVNNISALGANTRVLGCVGDDADGEWIINKLKSGNTDVSFMKKDTEQFTIVKTRLVSKNQQYLRCDEEVIKDIPQSYEEYVQENIDNIFRDISVIIISDYGKGAVTESLAQIVIKEANKRNIPIVVDPKGTNYGKYYGATVCTPNMNELQVVMHCSVESEEDIMSVGEELREKTNLTYLMVTRSENGISVIENENTKKDFPALKKDVIDVTGAGDTVVSIVSLCLGVGLTIDEACVLANIAASNVCSKFGAATLTMGELVEGVLYSGEYKLVNYENIAFIVDNLKRKGKKIVFTNGCFDLVHAGHLSSFEQARAFGDVLIVAMNSDASIKRIKGEKRPILDEKNRKALLCALECIDYVIVMEEDTPEELIKLIKPDVAVKGKDWENKNIPEEKLVASYGGIMKFIDLEKGLSTTNIISKIIDLNSEK